MIYPLYSRYTCNIYILCAIVGLGGHGFRPPALLTRSRLRLARVTGRSCSSAEEQRARRPYDGLARAMCEADLVSMDVPRWAYDERGIRRPLLEAEIARDLWYELDHALGRLPGEPKRAEADRSPVIKFYRASWEPDRGMVDVAFDVDLPS